MRIIHTSDWHLGQYFYGKSRANEHQQFLTWLLSQVKTHEVDAIIVAGDIFDTATPPSYAREMYFEFIASLKAQSLKLGKACQLIVLAGNHDSVAMLSESKTVLANLNTQVIAQATPIINESLVNNDTQINEQVFPIYNEQSQVSAIICAIPFIRPRDVIRSSAGQSASDKQRSLQQAISDHYQSLYQQAATQVKAIEVEQGGIVPIIATGHLTALGVSINDSQSDSVRDIYIGSLEAFPASAFPPADYIALGHIHRAQKIAKSEHIRYCGSPIPLSFDEAKQEKCVLLAEFNNGKLKKVTDISIPCFQPLYMVKTTIETLDESIQRTVNLFEQYLEKKIEQDALTAQVELNAWLDIEIDNSDHLTDLSQRVNELTKELPVEVLLVRRSKKARQRKQSQLSQHDNSTLSELTLNEVFDSRLSQLDWQSDEEKSRLTRLKQLFTEISSELVDGVELDKAPDRGSPNLDSPNLDKPNSSIAVQQSKLDEDGQNI